MNERSQLPDAASVRLLIVEKHPGIRAGLCTLIEAWRWPNVVVEATDGFANACQALAAQWPSLVLLDMELPQGDSITLLQQLKAQRPHTPVLAWMLYPTSQTAALQAGADACFYKGAPACELKQVIIDLVLSTDPGNSARYL
jgi:DNA-binding NarL/FixJ family response regulator